MPGRYLLLVIAVVFAALYLRLRDSAPSPVVAAELSTRLANEKGAVLAAEIPSELTRPLLAAALRDPFLSVQQPAPTQPASAQKNVTPPSLPATPEAPPLGLTFVGRLIAPDGTATVIASTGSDTISLRPGQSLPNGYRVESLDEQAVHLSYPPLNTAARLDLPAAPRYETR